MRINSENISIKYFYKFKKDIFLIIYFLRSPLMSLSIKCSNTSNINIFITLIFYKVKLFSVYLLGPMPITVRKYSIFLSFLSVFSPRENFEASQKQAMFSKKVDFIKSSLLSLIVPYTIERSTFNASTIY